MPDRSLPAHIFQVCIGTIATVAISVAVACLLPKLGWSLPNPAWEAQLAQAERDGDEEIIRRSRYARNAGTLRYPDGYPNVAPGATYHASCCGEADLYEADDFETDAAGNLLAILTCNGKAACEEFPGKIPRAQGTKIRIPPERMLVNHSPVNDTGHGFVWISPTSTDADGNPSVYCYAFPAGG